MTRMNPRTKDEPIVPKLSPPFSVDLVSTSPMVAPNGRVRTNAIQNNKVLEILVENAAKAVRASNAAMSSAPPANPRPESSAKKSPSAVPKVLEKRMAVQYNNG